jgi:hypothetical protein
MRAVKTKPTITAILGVTYDSIESARSIEAVKSISPHPPALGAARQIPICSNREAVEISAARPGEVCQGQSGRGERLPACVEHIVTKSLAQTKAYATNYFRRAGVFFWVAPAG